MCSVGFNGKIPRSEDYIGRLPYVCCLLFLLLGVVSGDEEGKEGEPHGGSSQGFVAIAEISPEPIEEGVEGVEGEVEMGEEEEDRLYLLPESIRETLSCLLLDKSVNVLLYY